MPNTITRRICPRGERSNSNEDGLVPLLGDPELDVEEHLHQRLFRGEYALGLGGLAQLPLEALDEVAIVWEGFGAF